MTVKETHGWTNDWNQYYATIAANIIMCSQGTVIGWVSPALSKLTSEDTPLLSGPLTNEQISWIGSVNCLGSLLGSTVFGFFIGLMGCKRAMLLLTIPSTVHWLLIFFGNQYYHILLAKLCDGIVTGGSTSTIVLFVSEIANNNIRGRLLSFPLVFRNIGIFTAYLVGATVDYKYIPCICVFVPIAFVILFSTVSNTPQYYLHNEKPHKAENALKYYKGYEGSNDEEDKALYDEFERLKSISMKRKIDEKFTMADFCNSDAIKGLGTGVALVIFSHSTANFPFISYSVLIFKIAGTSIDPHVSSIIFAISLIIGSLLSTYMADVFGRKSTNIISLSGSAIGMFTLSAYQYFNMNGYDLSACAWVPVVCLCFVILISSAGIVPLAFVCSVECIPPKLRTFGLTIVTFFLSLFGFISAKSFPILMSKVGLNGTMSLYGTACVLGAIFVVFCCKETRGQAIDEKNEDKEKIDSKNKAIQPLISQGVSIDNVETAVKTNVETDLGINANKPLISEQKVK